MKITQCGQQWIYKPKIEKVKMVTNEFMDFR